MKLDFDEIFDAFIESTKKKWAHNRDKTVGASEAFGCLRQTWFKKRGGEFGFEQDEDDDASWGATKRGDILEEHYVVPAVRDNLPGTGKLLLGGQHQKTFFKGLNSATPDGLIIGLDSDALAKYGIADIGSDCIVLEIKSIDPRVSLVEEKSIHNGQVHIQMAMIREQTEYRPNYAVILYVDASFLDEIDVFVVPFDPNMWKLAQERANSVYSVDKPEDIMPEGKITQGCGFCEWTAACAKVTIGAMPTAENKVSKLVLAAMLELVKVRQEAVKAEKAAKKKIEETNQEIKDFLRTNGTKRMGVPKVWSVNHSSQGGRKGLNKEAVAEAGIDLEPFMVAGNPFDVLRVTLADSSVDLG